MSLRIYIFICYYPVCRKQTLVKIFGRWADILNFHIECAIYQQYKMAQKVVPNLYGLNRCKKWCTKHFSACDRTVDLWIKRQKLYHCTIGLLTKWSQKFIISTFRKDCLLNLPAYVIISKPMCSLFFVWGSLYRHITFGMVRLGNKGVHKQQHLNRDGTWQGLNF